MHRFGSPPGAAVTLPVRGTKSPSHRQTAPDQDAPSPERPGESGLYERGKCWGRYTSCFSLHTLRTCTRRFRPGLRVPNPLRRRSCYPFTTRRRHLVRCAGNRTALERRCIPARPPPGEMPMIASSRTPPRHEKGGNGLERRPLVGTAGRRPAGDVPLFALGDRNSGASPTPSCTARKPSRSSASCRALHGRGARCRLEASSPGGGRRSKPAAPSRRLADPPDCIFAATDWRSSPSPSSGGTAFHSDRPDRRSREFHHPPASAAAILPMPSAISDSSIAE